MLVQEKERESQNKKTTHMFSYICNFKQFSSIFNLKFILRTFSGWFLTKDPVNKNVKILNSEIIGSYNRCGCLLYDVCVHVVWKPNFFLLNTWICHFFNVNVVVNFLSQVIFVFRLFFLVRECMLMKLKQRRNRNYLG